MKVNKIIKIALGASALTVSVATSTQVSAAAVTVVNAGFNDQTGWGLLNDAQLAEAGGPAGWTWVTPVAGNTVTSTEAIAPTEGTGFGITYAGADAFTQNVNILTAGDYIFSVDANALTGTVNLSNSPAIARPLLDGAFSLFAGSAFSPNMDVITTDDWMTFTWTTTLSAGLLDVGLRNTNLAIYSIAFDNFSITEVPQVPVPAAFWLFGSGLIGLIGVARRKKS